MLFFSNIPKISPEELIHKINSKENLILLDVREPHELEGSLGSIEGILNIPLNDLNKRTNELKQNPDALIVVICHSGNRAATGAKYLQSAGIKKVVLLDGGMVAFRKAQSDKI